jgi:hypothetical protein
MELSQARGWKKAARELCRDIAANVPDGPVAGQLGEFLAALLRRHPDADEKIGPGIAHICVGSVPGYRSRGFTVHRTDGTSTDFSWRACITEPSHAAQVNKAMRQAVAGQILDYKRAEAAAGRLRSAITGDELAPDDAEVDHFSPSFAALADRYAEVAGGYDAIGLAPSADGQIGQRLDPDHEIIWQAYHQQAARLRILSKAEHARLSKERLTH